MPTGYLNPEGLPTLFLTIFNPAGKGSNKAGERAVICPLHLRRKDAGRELVVLPMI